MQTDAYIYLDANATTPLDSVVRDAMTPYYGEAYGNASSPHAPGRRARQALEEAREEVAALLGARPEEILFTASATEANNQVLRGVRSPDATRRRLALSGGEHDSLWKTAQQLRREQIAVDVIALQSDGMIAAASYRHILTQQPVLVSIAYANHETGVIQDIPALAQQAKSAGAIFHTDAVQAAGKLPLRITDLGVDLLTLSGHKIYGPQGVGVLYIRRGVLLESLLYGGAQERRRRAGTENVPACVGMARALALAVTRLETDAAHYAKLRKLFITTLRQTDAMIQITGTAAPRLPNTVHVLAPGVRNEVLLMRLDLAGIGISTGSACASGAAEPSHVLAAMGIPAAAARGALRISFLRDTTAAAAAQAATLLGRLARELRGAPPTI